jgi:membrane protease YdiL (CAAX protease family)
MDAPELQVELPEEVMTPLADVPWGVFLALTVLLLCTALQVFSSAACGLAAWLLDGGGGRVDYDAWLVTLSADAHLALMGWTAVCAAVSTLCVLALLTTLRGRGRSWLQVFQLCAPQGRWLRQSALCLGAGLFAYFGLQLAQSAFSEAFEYAPTPQRAVALVAEAQSGSAMLMMFIAVVVLAPIVEELLFRCVLYLPLRRACGVLPAALIVGAVFSGVHFYLWGALHLLVLSLVFTALLERTKSLWPAVLAHALNNALTFFLVLFDVV